MREKLNCLFCRGECRPVYRMDGYPVWRCRDCGSGLAWPPPDGNTLREFYDGFLFEADMRRYPAVRSSAALLFPFTGLAANNRLKMLDVGGGGGFYARAFEELGFGTSCYIDLDPRACEFARKLGIGRVVEGNAEAAEDVGDMFDLILCRHLIEHLVDPPSFILRVVRHLNPGGRLLLVCPNGNSLEYLAYPFSNIRARLASVWNSNRYGALRVLAMLSGKSLLHGLHPPRHLWAITAEGLGAFLTREKLPHAIHFFPLSDRMVSPYFRARRLLWPFMAFGRLLAGVRGGTHLLCLVKAKGELMNRD